MINLSSLEFFVILLCCVSPEYECLEQTTEYEPTWESLDTRPLPCWYDEAKIGIFIHWGVFSVPSFGSEWFWKDWKEEKKDFVHFVKKNFPPGFSYQEFAKEFTAEFYNASEWADLFEQAGARYIVLTSKHHEGYTLWPSKNSFSWNSLDVGSHRDLVGELADAIRSRTNIRFGLYHSLYEWYNPLYLQDKQNNFTTNDFVTTKALPELYDLVETYKPEVIWSDGDWETTDDYWTSKHFISWLYNRSPSRLSVVTNDRWGRGVLCKHGDFFTCKDRYNPGTLQKHKWENCLTIDKKSWGYRRNSRLDDYMTIEDIILQLVTTVSCGGNFLINVGPTKEGVITPIYEERLRQMGEWLRANSEAIYGSKPWTYQNDTLTTDVWFTYGAGDYVYAAFKNWPKNGVLNLRVIKLSSDSEVTILGCTQGSSLKWSETNEVTKIQLPDHVRSCGQWMWVLKFDRVLN